MNGILIGGLLLSAVFAFIFLRHKKRSQRLKKLRDEWGNIPDKQLDLDSVRIFYKLSKSNIFENSYKIDDDTWRDLDLDKIYSIINRTVTPVGAQYLFYILKHPLSDEKTLKQRDELVNNFLKNRKLRESVQLILQALDERNVRYLPYSLWEPLPEKPAYAFFVPVMTFVAVGVLLLVLLNYIHVSALMIVFIVNLIIRSIVKRKIDIFIFSFQYLGLLINTAEKAAAVKFDELETVNKNLKKNLKGCKKIAKKIFSLQIKDELGFFEFFNSYFLWDISGFYSAIDNIKDNLEELRNLFQIIGYLDALISIASFREEYNVFCAPRFNTSDYIVEDVYNPLLANPVPNTLQFDKKNIMITGSNMAGKTTFLKTIGVNAVLAQTIYMSMAEKYSAPFLKVVSSIMRQDNLIEGKSYYLSEVESVLRIIKASETEITHLFILDEIFRGTNSEERFAASFETLKYLANGKDYILAATHDLRLSNMLDSIYRNLHFQEKVSGKGLAFDYKLRQGIAATRNAIALLQYVGYPKKIIENANKHIKGGRNEEN
jgi:hypothetical protein